MDGLSLLVNAADQLSVQPPAAAMPDTLMQHHAMGAPATAGANKPGLSSAAAAAAAAARSKPPAVATVDFDTSDRAAIVFLQRTVTFGTAVELEAADHVRVVHNAPGMPVVMVAKPNLRPKAGTVSFDVNCEIPYIHTLAWNQESRCSVFLASSTTGQQELIGTLILRYLPPLK